MDTIKLGGDITASAKPAPTTQLRHLPNRLSREVCLQLIAHHHPEWTLEGLTAAGKQLDVREIDAALEHSALSTLDKISLKSACAEFGIISRGRPINRR